MTDAPERIWVWPDYNDHFNPVKQDWTHGFWDSTEDSLGTEYVRADHIKAQAAEIERLNIQCEGLFQAAMNNGQALIIAESKLAKALKELEWQASQPEAHPFMAQHARTTLAEIKGENHDTV